MYQHFVVSNGCYTHVKPKIVTKKDVKDIKGISTQTQTHKHTLYIYKHYTHTYIYIYIYIYIQHIQGST